MLKLIIAAALLLGGAAAFASPPTDAEISACTPDALKFCAAEVETRDGARIGKCLQARGQELAPACRAAFVAHGWFQPPGVRKAVPHGPARPSPVTTPHKPAAPAPAARPAPAPVPLPAPPPATFNERWPDPATLPPPFVQDPPPAPAVSAPPPVPAPSVSAPPANHPAKPKGHAMSKFEFAVYFFALVGFVVGTYYVSRHGFGWVWRRLTSARKHLAADVGTLKTTADALKTKVDALSVHTSLPTDPAAIAALAAKAKPAATAVASAAAAPVAAAPAAAAPAA